MRNPGVAAVLSFFIPGLGQIYNGQIGMAIVYFVFAIFSVIACSIIIGFITTPIIWIVGIIDAYRSAEKLNKGSR